MNELTYRAWMQAVDAIVTEAVGLSVHDLPDWSSRDAYDDEMSPLEGAVMALEDADAPDEVIEELERRIDNSARRTYFGQPVETVLL